jgi:hypothetical protein
MKQALNYTQMHSLGFYAKLNHIKSETGIIHDLKPLITQAIALNFVIIGILIISKLSSLVALIMGALIILYLSMIGIKNPDRLFLLIFGIKFTFDTLWVVRYEGMPIGLMELIFIPFGILIISGERIRSHPLRKIIHAVLAYIMLVLIAMIVNQTFDLEIIIRQSGMLVGLLMGLKYLKSPRHLYLLFLMIFISTILPILLSSLQLIPTMNNFFLFHNKFDTERLFRPSGLYYDSATAGMVCIISLFANIILLRSSIIRNPMKSLHFIMLPLSFALIIVGGTRSVIAIAGLLLAFFMFRRLRYGFWVALFMGVAIIVFQPYIDRVLSKTSTDVPSVTQVRDMMNDPTKRTMLTGRVGLWQDVWNEFNKRPWIEQLFGTGVSANAHSTYFYLLLQIGWFGILYFIAINLMLLLKIGRLAALTQLKFIGYLSLLSFMLISISLTAVAFTTFQWATYLLVGGVLRIGVETMKEASLKQMEWANRVGGVHS